MIINKQTKRYVTYHIEGWLYMYLIDSNGYSQSLLAWGSATKQIIQRLKYKYNW